MTEPTEPTAETGAPDRTRLSPVEIAGLRRASSWARLIAIVGFVFAGLFGLGLGMFIAVRARFAMTFTLTTTLVSIVAAVIFAAVAARQLLVYGRGVASFLSQREPALPGAFRSLRYFFWVYSAYAAFSAALQLFMVLRGS